MYIMSKARSMYAGSSGSNYGVNKNSPGNGNGKWQGLWPSVGHARNARHINIEAGGNNRNVVFCMNQLGGVGRISNMFATTADGVKQPCPGADNSPWWFNNPAILAALQAVGNYVLTNTTYNSDPNNPLVYVAFIGDAESLKTDHIKNQTGYDPNDPSWLFEPLEPTTSSSSVNNAIKLLNSMKLQFTVNGKIQTHVVGIVGEKAIMALENAGYGLYFFLGDNLLATAFGSCSHVDAHGGKNKVACIPLTNTQERITYGAQGDGGLQEKSIVLLTGGRVIFPDGSAAARLKDLGNLSPGSGSMYSDRRIFSARKTPSD